MGEVGEGLDTGVDLALEDLGVDPVRGDVGDVEGLGVLAHRAEGGTGSGEVRALALEGVEAGRRVFRGKGVGVGRRP
ncbi:hypothetical protein GCM10010211_36210 [Streptomyces albospinus]|uniref:Uncharacterized protein n=1 Tax=Streptomyces albospinus TaxID=285515 RepID=A0ABQ2V477_9ACTN|nr:hypothetical protein GCM10010211_36210 [Streptomyces albospinus]